MEAAIGGSSRQMEWQRHQMLVYAGRKWEESAGVAAGVAPMKGRASCQRSVARGSRWRSEQGLQLIRGCGKGV